MIIMKYGCTPWLDPDPLIPRPSEAQMKYWDWRLKQYRLGMDRAKVNKLAYMDEGFLSVLMCPREGPWGRAKPTGPRGHSPDMEEPDYDSKYQAGAVG
jgi:hypothetical protein